MARLIDEAGFWKIWSSGEMSSKILLEVMMKDDGSDDEGCWMGWWRMLDGMMKDVGWDDEGCWMGWWRMLDGMMKDVGWDDEGCWMGWWRMLDGMMKDVGWDDEGWWDDEGVWSLPSPMSSKYDLNSSSPGFSLTLVIRQKGLTKLQRRRNDEVFNGGSLFVQQAMFVWNHHREQRFYRQPECHHW